MPDGHDAVQLQVFSLLLISFQSLIYPEDDVLLLQDLLRIAGVLLAQACDEGLLAAECLAYRAAQDLGEKETPGTRVLSHLQPTSTQQIASSLVALSWFQPLPSFVACRNSRFL
jgi:hypothetical protein